MKLLEWISQRNKYWKMQNVVHLRITQQLQTLLLKVFLSFFQPLRTSSYKRSVDTSSEDKFDTDTKYVAYAAFNTRYLRYILR